MNTQLLAICNSHGLPTEPVSERKPDQWLYRRLHRSESRYNPATQGKTIWHHYFIIITVFRLELAVNETKSS